MKAKSHRNKIRTDVQIILRTGLDPCSVQPLGKLLALPSGNFAARSKKYKGDGIGH